MSNLEDVFLKINQEFAPDLFGGLKGFGARENLKQSALSQALSIAHSTEKKESIAASQEYLLT